MRILWLTPGFAADEQDHNCIPPLQLLARKLAARGVDLHIVALEYPFREQPYSWHDVSVYPCDGRNRGWLKWRTWRRAARLAHQIIAESPVDAVHSFWLGRAAGIGEKVAAEAGIRHFTTLMGQDVLPGNRRLLRTLNPERARRLIAVSEFQNTALEKTTGFRANHVIRWGIVPVTPTVSRPLVFGADSLFPVTPTVSRPLVFGADSLFSVTPTASRPHVLGVGSLLPVTPTASRPLYGGQRYDVTPADSRPHILGAGSLLPVAPTVSRPHILGVGSLLPVKNWKKWLRVLALTAPQFPGLRAELIGDGPERSELKRLARQLDLEETVRFAGNLPRAEVLQKMEEAAVLLHTADFESFGYVLAEAAACGCRVVGTPVGVAEELGRTAESEQDLANLLMAALREKERPTPFVPFTMDKTVESYLNLYNSGH